MLFLRASCLSLFAILGLAGCSNADEGALDIAWIGSEDSLFADSQHMSSGAQLLRGATEAGLVALDQQGEVVPALADRWIITEDGLSFIFRLREGEWPNGDEMTSDSVRRALMRSIRALDGTSLGLDLAPIEEVRAMAGKVIEIRLRSPVPDLLQMLAQPELTMLYPGGGTGRMAMQREGGAALLQFKPPADRGLPEDEDWREHVRDLRLMASDAASAMAMFDDGEVSVVLGGRIDHLPLVDTGPLSRGTVRLDPAIGLFGLQVRNDSGLLSDDGRREALAMALDRQALVSRYNVGGWVPTTRLVPPGLPGDPGLIVERWPDIAVADLRATAARRVREWASLREGADDEPPALTLAIGEAPGLDLLYRDLAAQFATIGVRLLRAEDRDRADLVLVDRTARYANPRWFLNQFHCSLNRGLCSDEADALVARAQDTIDPVERAALLAQAEAALTLANVFIPIGAPLRWSLVRGDVDGYLANPYAYHPLPPLARLPN